MKSLMSSCRSDLDASHGMNSNRLQVSSIATLGATNKWLTETFFSALAPSVDTNPAHKASIRNPSFSIVFPTAPEIRASLDGYSSGDSIHCKLHSVTHQKQLGYLRPYLRHWAGASLATDAKAQVETGSNSQRRAKPPDTQANANGRIHNHNNADRGIGTNIGASIGTAGRHHAAPHIKTYIRFAGPPAPGTPVDWALLSSANLSTQAWGSAAVDAGAGAGRSKTKGGKGRKREDSEGGPIKGEGGGGRGGGKDRGKEGNPVETQIAPGTEEREREREQERPEEFQVRVCSWETGVLVWPELLAGGKGLDEREHRGVNTPSAKKEEITAIKTTTTYQKASTKTSTTPTPTSIMLPTFRRDIPHTPPPKPCTPTPHSTPPSQSPTQALKPLPPSPAPPPPSFSSSPAPSPARPSAATIIGIRMPYDLPLVPYAVEEEPWCNTVSHAVADRWGQVWNVGGW